MVKNIPKVQNLLICLLIFLLPSNLAYHFILPSSYVRGVLVDYLIPTVYLTDILIAGLFILWIADICTQNPKLKALNSKQIPKSKYQISKKIFNLKFPIFNQFSITKFSVSKLIHNSLIINHKSLFFIFYFLFFIFNLAVASNPLAAAYKWLKITEMTWLFWNISNYLNNLKPLDKVVQLHNFVKIISLSTLWQSGLAIAQWWKQGNIFPYWFFGEQPFSANAPGVKTIAWFGQLKVLPLGTFPHPNVLAAFLALSLFILISHISFKRWVAEAEGVPSSARNSASGGGGHRTGRASDRTHISSYYLITAVVASFTLFLTFSLPAWTVFLGAVFWSVRQKIHIKGVNQIILAGLLAVILSYGLVHFGNPASFLRRKQLAAIAWKMWQSSPLVGVGLNNFTVRMPEFGEVAANIRFLQPVHNVPLLILAETGIIGFALFFYLLFSLSKTLKLFNSKTLLFLFLLFLSLFDHYFLTTQQGLLMVAIFIPLIASCQKNKKVVHIK